MLRQKSNEPPRQRCSAISDVFEHRQVRKNRRDLKRAHQPEPGDIGRVKGCDVAAFEHDATARGVEKLAEQIEASGFPRPVRADHGVNGAARNPQIDGAHGDKTGKILGQVFGLKNRITSHNDPPLDHSWQI